MGNPCVINQYWGHNGSFNWILMAMDYLGKIKPGLRVFWRNTPTKSIQITIWGDLGWGPYHLPQIPRAICKHQRHAVITMVPASWFSCTSTLEACNKLQGLHLHWRNLNDFFVAQTVSRAFMKKKCNTEASKDQQDMIYIYICIIFIPGPSSLGAKWFRWTGVNSPSPLGFNWHPLKGTGRFIQNLLLDEKLVRCSSTPTVMHPAFQRSRSGYLDIF